MVGKVNQSYPIFRPSKAYLDGGKGLPLVGAPRPRDGAGRASLALVSEPKPLRGRLLRDADKGRPLGLADPARAVRAHDRLRGHGGRYLLLELRVGLGVAVLYRVHWNNN